LWNWKRRFELLDNLRTGKAKRSGARRWAALNLVQQINPAKKYDNSTFKKINRQVASAIRLPSNPNCLLWAFARQ
jgi:hypothetical protein